LGASCHVCIPHIPLIAANDRTGPAAQINFMGYAKAGQTGHGIHQRLRSRAFIIAEPPTGVFPEEEFVAVAREVEGQERSRLRWKSSSPQETEEVPTPSRVSHIDPEKTICFVSMDAGMVCWTDGHDFRLHCIACMLTIVAAPFYRDLTC
jgi:hypothetical protein